MGCRCNERRAAIAHAAGAAVRGNVVEAARDIAFVARTSLEDLRTDGLRRTMASKLSLLRMPRRA